jgi:hypothetical protein
MNARLTAILATMLLVLTACSGDSDDATSSEAGGPDRLVEGGEDFGYSTVDASNADQFDSGSAAERAAPAADQAVQPGPGGTESEEVVDPIDTGRQIIRTAEIVTEVTDVAAAAQRAINIVQSVGGLLFNQDTRVATNTAEPNRTTLVFRVPPEDFQKVLNDLGGIGSIREQRIDATDVTGRVVDLESRITSTELSVERLRGFLSAASDLNQVATFENELRDRETELETLRGQLRTLQNQVALSTITLTLTEILPPPPPEPSLRLASFVYSGHDGGFSCGTTLERAEDRDDLTLCYEVTNTGDTGLVDIALRDSALSLDIDDLTIVEGVLDESLEPGQRLMFAHEFTASGTRLISTAKVQGTAVPAADADDDEIGAETASAKADLALTIYPRETAPGFADGLDAGWRGFTALIGAVLLAIGFALPFIWVPPLAWIGVREWRRRRPIRPAPLPTRPTVPDPPARQTTEV